MYYEAEIPVSWTIECEGCGHEYVYEQKLTAGDSDKQGAINRLDAKLNNIRIPEKHSSHCRNCGFLQTWMHPYWVEFNARLDPQENGIVNALIWLGPLIAALVIAITTSLHPLLKLLVLILALFIAITLDTLYTNKKTNDQRVVLSESDPNIEWRGKNQYRIPGKTSLPKPFFSRKDIKLYEEVLVERPFS